MSNEFFTVPDTSVWVQVGGTIPGQAFELLACGETTDTEISIGEREPILAPDLSQRGKWRIVGQKYAPPELHSTGIRMYMPPAVLSILEELARTHCKLTIQVPVGPCSRPDEFNTGWQSKLLYEYASLSSLSIPALASVEGATTDPVYIEGPMKFEFYGRIKPIRFTERAAATLVAEALDGVYCDAPVCGDCGPYSPGCEHLYVITVANPGSPGLSGQLVYTNDGVNFATVDIPTLGGLSPNRIACVGDFLLVISEAARNHQYIQKAAVLAAGDWVEVETGYVAGHGPRAIYVKSTSEIFIVGAAGYIYKADDYQTEVTVIEDGSVTAEDYNDVDGDGGDVIVAVTDNNGVVVSTNGGETFGLLVGPQLGADLNAVAVLDRYNWIIGGDAGAFYRTNDGGATYTAIPFVGAGAGAIVHSIRFSETPSVGYAAIEIASVGYVYRTTDGGTHWFRTAPAIQGLDDNDRIRFVAPCPSNLNVVAAGGLGAAGNDGYLAIAQ